MGSGSRPLGTRSSSRPRLRKLLAGLIPRVYSLVFQYGGSSGRSNCWEEFSPDSILEIRVSQNLSKVHKMSAMEGWRELE